MKEEKLEVSFEKGKGVNPKKEPLTIEKVKELMNRPDMSDEEAQEIMFSVKQLVSILIETD